MGVMLFRAIRMTKNARGHPVLAALLRAFCPQALYWWRQGVDPEEVVHVHTLALDDMAAGRSLGEVLREAGFSEEFVRQEVARYLDVVDQFRVQNPGIPAPETTPFFSRVFRKMGPAMRFGKDEAARRIGGWDNFYEYLRTHAFLFEDWARSMHLDPASARVEQVTMTLMARPLRLPALYPVWMWTDGHNVVVGILHQTPADLLAADFIQFFGRSEGIQPPFAVWLMRADGAEPHRRVMGVEALERLMESEASQPYPPPPGWPEGMYAERCHLCGFRHLCWEEVGKPRTLFLFREIEALEEA